MLRMQSPTRTLLTDRFILLGLARHIHSLLLSFLNPDVLYIIKNTLPYTMHDLIRYHLYPGNHSRTSSDIGFPFSLF